MKFINVTLKGWNEKVLKDPIKKGKRYNVKKRLFKYFSTIY